MSGCASHRPAQPLRPAPAEGEAAAPGPLAAALRAVLEGSLSRDEVRIESECRSSDSYRSVVIFGSGVGVWEGNRQFRLSRDKLDRLLEAFDRNRFFALAETYGGRRERRKPDEQLALTVTCSVELGIGSLHKRVTRVEPGPQLPELQRLADTIFGATARLGRSGVTVASLHAGLRDVASGSLMPEVLLLSAQYAPAREPEGGWLLHLDGQRVSSQEMRVEAGARVLRMSSDEVRVLAALLIEAGVWELPMNLPADDYTDLRVEILGQTKQVQARSFAGRPKAAADAERLEQILGALERLHRRAMIEGTPDEGS